MKRFTLYLSVSFALLLVAGCKNSNQKNTFESLHNKEVAIHDTIINKYVLNIKKEREKFVQELLHTDKILNNEEQAHLKKIRFFPVDTSWVITAPFEADTGKIFNMPTSTARMPRYQRIGWVHITHDTNHFKLAVFQNIELKKEQYKHLGFIPFVDGNAPETTYGGGRYLDIENLEPGQKEVTIDFNKAYNPYCCYSYRYSCPITPKINHINVKINAGVKNPIKTE